MSKCLFCKSGEMRAAQTTYAVDIKTCVVVVRNVPCEECDICGEKIISDAVMENLENIVDAAEIAASEIYVTDYRKQVERLNAVA